MDGVAFVQFWEFLSALGLVVELDLKVMSLLVRAQTVGGPNPWEVRIHTRQVPVGTYEAVPTSAHAAHTQYANTPILSRSHALVCLTEVLEMGQGATLP